MDQNAKQEQAVDPYNFLTFDESTTLCLCEEAPFECFDRGPAIIFRRLESYGLVTLSKEGRTEDSRRRLSYFIASPTDAGRTEMADTAEGDRCRRCGCTDDRACATEDGPCSWAEPGLCSACASGAVS